MDEKLVIRGYLFNKLVITWYRLVAFSYYWLRSVSIDTEMSNLAPIFKDMTQSFDK